MGKREDILREVMSGLARRGGLATAKKLSKQQRIERARKAGKASAKVRQAKAKKKG